MHWDARSLATCAQILSGRGRQGRPPQWSGRGCGGRDARAAGPRAARGAAHRSARPAALAKQDAPARGAARYDCLKPVHNGHSCLNCCEGSLQTPAVVGPLHNTSRRHRQCNVHPAAASMVTLDLLRCMSSQSSVPTFCVQRTRKAGREVPRQSLRASAATTPTSCSWSSTTLTPSQCGTTEASSVRLLLQQSRLRRDIQQQPVLQTIRRPT